MPKTTRPSLPAATPGLSMLPANATVKALVIGIENYLVRSDHSLRKVDYARDDAEGFMDALRTLYGDRLDGEMIVDSGATLTNIQYQLRAFIASCGLSLDH
ncbi:MAG: hypothetical protein CPDRYMAC_5886 [uncultured Paraburkholderia sp.]|nr:MAG: hypothetical protein CPDRYDRY_5827 [uncultured Paraburkholderia sp.]CAH2942800.1 MAG: hypothetical protein CPDRYMAC_5886 [uncultured Paraburkholderia sp.]